MTKEPNKRPKQRSTVRRGQNPMPITGLVDATPGGVTSVLASKFDYTDTM